VSITFSGLSALNGIYKFLWYRLIAKSEKCKNMEDIPIDGLLVWALELIQLLPEVITKTIIYHELIKYFSLNDLILIFIPIFCK